MKNETVQRSSELCGTCGKDKQSHVWANHNWVAREQLPSNPMVQLLRDWLKGCPNPPEWHWTFDLHVRTVNLLGNIPPGNDERAALQAILDYPGLPAIIYGIAQSALRTPDETRARPLSATDRLHNLCDALSEQADESPFTREEWEAIDKQTVRLTNALKGLIDAIRNLEIGQEPWRLFVGHPLQSAYRALKHEDPLSPLAAAVEIARGAPPSEPVRLAQKAFVQLCAPHGKDWLTCPECAKAAGIGGEQRG